MSVFNPFSLRKMALKAVLIVDLEEKSRVPPKNPKDIGGVTPLFLAAQSGWLEGARFLVLHEADVDQALVNTKETPLYVASQNGHADLVRFLVDSLANVDQETTDGATPTFIASQMGHYGIVDMLLQANSRIDTPNWMGGTALFIAAQQLGQNHAAVIF